MEECGMDLERLIVDDAARDLLYQVRISSQ